MHQVSSRLIPDPENAERSLVAIAIDGHDLLELVRAHEMPYALRESHETLAGGYQYLSAQFNLGNLSAKHRETSSDDEDKVAVAECACGVPGCWPLCCEIVYDVDQTIVWRNFEQPHRGPDSAGGFWDYSRFGPFRFSQRQYEHALSVIAEQCSPHAP